MAETIEEAAFAFMKANAAVAALTAQGTRIFPMRMPDDVDLSSLGIIVYQKISGQRLVAHDRNSGMGNPRIQFACFASSYLTAKKLAAAVVKCWNGYGGQIDQIGQGGAWVEDERDFYEKELSLYKTTVDVIFLHQEAVS